VEKSRKKVRTVICPVLKECLKSSFEESGDFAVMDCCHTKPHILDDKSEDTTLNCAIELGECKKCVSVKSKKGLQSLQTYIKFSMLGEPCD
jgi:hypothetical protein